MGFLCPTFNDVMRGIQSRKCMLSRWYRVSQSPLNGGIVKWIQQLSKLCYAIEVVPLIDEHCTWLTHTIWVPPLFSCPYRSYRYPHAFIQSRYLIDSRSQSVRFWLIVEKVDSTRSNKQPLVLIKIQVWGFPPTSGSRPDRLVFITVLVSVASPHSWKQ